MSHPPTMTSFVETTATNFPDIFEWVATATKNNPIAGQSSMTPIVMGNYRLLGDIGRGLTLLNPITLTIEYSEDLFVVSDDLLGIYGDGDTEQEALADYKISLIDFYEMSRAQASLREIDRALFEHLQEYIAEVQ